MPADLVGNFPAENKKGIGIGLFCIIRWEELAEYQAKNLDAHDSDEYQYRYEPQVGREAECTGIRSEEAREPWTFGLPGISQSIGGYRSHELRKFSVGDVKLTLAARSLLCVSDTFYHIRWNVGAFLNGIVQELQSVLNAVY